MIVGELGIIINVYEFWVMCCFSFFMCCLYFKEMDVLYIRGEMCGRNVIISEENESEGGINVSVDIG